MGTVVVVLLVDGGDVSVGVEVLSGMLTPPPPGSLEHAAIKANNTTTCR
jgi:hypothetical protein